MTRDRSSAQSPLPPEPRSPDWDAIGRFLADESSAEEAVVVRQWLAEHPADAELVTALDRSADGLATVPAGDIDVEAALRGVIARRDAPEIQPLSRPIRRGISARPASRWQSGALRAAAVVAIAVTGAFAWWIMRSDRGGAPGGSTRTYTTTVGQRDSVRLPDGSRVLLAPGSQLVVAADYGSPRREVALRGEGFFDVRHDDAHAFTVRAGAAVIRDIGTVFTVRLHETGRVRVVVSEGAVLLDAARDPGVGGSQGVVLHQGDVGELAPNALAVAQRGAGTDDDVAWTRGRLPFHDAAIPDVAAELRRWYGVVLRVDDPTLAARHLNTSVLAGDTREQVLQTIALTLGATVRWNGDTATVQALGGR